MNNADIIAWIVFVVWFVPFCFSIWVIWKKYKYNLTHEYSGETPRSILLYHLVLLIIVGAISLFIMLGIGGGIWWNWFYTP